MHGVQRPTCRTVRIRVRAHVGVRVCPCLCCSVCVCVVRMTAELLVTVFPARSTLRSSSLNEITQLSSEREREMVTM